MFPSSMAAAAVASRAKLEKVSIASLDDSDPARIVHAQYNPKEVTLEHSIPWQGKPIRGDRADLEFTGGSARTLSLELLFDGYEQARSVQLDVDKVVWLARVRDPDSNKDQLLRPHLVAMVWGSPSSDNLPAFRGVIESLSIKYTMFLPDGRPVRATVGVKIKEATSVKLAKK